MLGEHWDERFAERKAPEVEESGWEGVSGWAEGGEGVRLEERLY